LRGKLIFPGAKFKFDNIKNQIIFFFFSWEYFFKLISAILRKKKKKFLSVLTALHKQPPRKKKFKRVNDSLEFFVIFLLPKEEFSFPNEKKKNTIKNYIFNLISGVVPPLAVVTPYWAIRKKGGDPLSLLEYDFHLVQFSLPRSSSIHRPSDIENGLISI
jgi:hypothetical protein